MLHIYMCNTFTIMFMLYIYYMLMLHIYCKSLLVFSQHHLNEE